MKISVEQYERLMRFLDLDMSVAEMKAFAAELDTNPDLREQLDFEEQVRSDLELMYGSEGNDLPVNGTFTEEELAQLRSGMEDTAEIWEDEQNKVLSLTQNNKNEEHPPVENLSRGSVLKLNFPVAVAATLLIAVALVYLFNIGSSTGTAIVKNIDTNGVKKRDENLVKTPGDTAIKTPSKKDINLASLFKTSYKKDTVPQRKPEIYASALTDYNDNYYRTIQKIDPDNLPEIRGEGNDPVNNKKYAEIIGHYYTGLSLIETNNLPQAMRNLQWVKDSADDESYAVKAQWYLALIYIKTAKIEEAKKLLQSVAANNTLLSYKTKAKELMKKME